MMRDCMFRLHLSMFLPVHLQTRLLESLKKFEQYETLLESIGENLSAQQERLEQDLAEPIPDLETARRRLETTRVSYTLQSHTISLSLSTSQPVSQ